MAGRGEEPPKLDGVLCSFAPQITPTIVEHLYDRSVWNPRLEILDEVHQSNAVNPLEMLKIPTAFRASEEAWRSVINTVKSYLIDFSLFLIG
jgi:hypothetical protein